MPGPPEEGLRRCGHQLQGFRLLRHRLAFVHVKHRELLEFSGLVGFGFLVREFIVEGLRSLVDSFFLQQFADVERACRRLRVPTAALPDPALSSSVR